MLSIAFGDKTELNATFYLTQFSPLKRQHFKAMKEELQKHLFNENMRVYAILDGASIDDLPAKIYEMRPRNFCLYRGALDTDIAEVAPYIVEMMPQTAFTEWLLENCWGKHWGIFAHSPFRIEQLRRHFRKFLTVYDDAGNPMLFRYYDPRVLTQFLPTCEPGELQELFGAVNAFFAESNETKDLVRYQFFNEQLQPSALDMKTRTGVYSNV